MTAIVGILCKDADVVIGTDSSTTFVHGREPTIEQQSNKINIIKNKIIVAGTGSVGLCQRHIKLIEKMWDDNKFKDSNIDIGKLISRNTIQDFLSTHFSQPCNPPQIIQTNFQFGSLVAFPCHKKLFLCEIEIGNLQPEFMTKDLWYCSMGIAQPITDPFLGLMREVFWGNNQPGLNEAVFAVTWTLDHAIKVNPGGVNGPINIAILTKDDKGEPIARILDDDELLEHRQNIGEAKEALKDWSDKFKYDDKGKITEIPKIKD